MQLTLPRPTTQPVRTAREPRQADHPFWLLLFILGSSLLIAGYTTQAYWGAILELRELGLSWPDRALVFWSVWAMVLLLLTPAMAFLGLRTVAPRSGVALLVGATTLISAWLATDNRLQHITGNHITEYLANVVTVSNWQWGGDLGAILVQLAGTCAAAVVAVLTVFGACRLAANRLRLDPEARGRRLRNLAVVYVLAIVGIVPARQAIGTPLALERLYAALPASVYLFDPEFVPGSGALAFGRNCDQEFESQGLLVHDCAMSPAPADALATVPEGSPNVILIIVESFRHMSIETEHMPKMAAWAKKGLVLGKHYANANRSEYGTFALLCGRYPFAYHSNVAAAIAPQFPVTFRNSGYRCMAIASCAFEYFGMNTFISGEHFDALELLNDGPWPDRDRLTLRRMAEVVQQSDRPSFILSYLMSTHFSYYYPPEYEKHANQVNGKAPRHTIKREDLLARYRNCLAFMDDELDGFLRSIDLKRNLVIITGDHGESFCEDGCVTHGSRLSEIQTRVPMLLLGGGVTPGTIHHPTGHVDVLPTVVRLLGGSKTHIAGGHGRDALAADHPQQAVSVHPMRDSWDVMLVRNEGRLKMNLRKDQPIIRVMGFCDSSAMVDPELQRDPSNIACWQQALECLRR